MLYDKTTARRSWVECKEWKLAGFALATFLIITYNFYRMAPVESQQTVHSNLEVYHILDMENKTSPESTVNDEKYPKTSNGEALGKLFNRLYRLGSYGALENKFSAFKPAMSTKYYHIYMDILRTFANTMESNNLTYVIYGGTLIGSLRHHGPIMWDDDVDILVNLDEKDLMVKAFKKLAPRYTLFTRDPSKPWKFYSVDSRKASPPLQWSWPMLDIFFFQITETALKDISWEYIPWVFPVNLVLPPKKRPFASLQLFAPRCALEFTSKKYDIEKCVSSTYCHQRQQAIPGKAITIDCKHLKDYYPFVNRKETETGIIEDLVFKGDVIHTMRYEPCTF